MDIRAVKFRVGSEWRVGGLYSPARSGSYPAVLFLHGFPGIQKNDDMAAELCRRGLVAFVPYFRGSWGSAGQYSVSGLIEDATAAARLLARYRHVDAGRLGVVGTSLGGWVALRLAAGKRFRAAVAMAPAVGTSVPGDAVSYLQKNGRVLNIADRQIALSDFARAMSAVPPERYLKGISPCPLLFVQGLKDPMILPASTRKLWSLAGPPKELAELKDEAHEFQNDRGAVVRLVCGWIEKRLGVSKEPVPQLRQISR